MALAQEVDVTRDTYKAIARYRRCIRRALNETTWRADMIMHGQAVVPNVEIEKRAKELFDERYSPRFANQQG